ncbi:hypothetical protein Tco_1116494 [Tanacetum coccineum]
MADLTFADSHNIVAYLEKSEDNADFAEIVNFLDASPIRQGKDFPGTVTPLFATMLIQPQEDVGEGLGQPIESQHIPTTASPSHVEPIPNVASSSHPKKTQKHSVERAATTATSLDVEQGSGGSPRRHGYHIEGQNCSNAKLESDSITDDITLAKTLVKRKSSASRSQKDKGVMFKEPSEPATTSRPQSHIPSKDKGKGIILQAELDEEAKLEREREREKEASKAATIAEWDDVQAMMDADYELAAKL